MTMRRASVVTFGFGATDAVGFAATAAASEIGPFLSPLDSSNVALLEVSTSLTSVSAQLRAFVSIRTAAARSLAPRAIGVTDRASGKTVITLKLRVAACGG